ncbi:hypothetical protein [Nocardiopsis dassonvillei]|uniref:hypothetical protein n=1 Tax=Nocardiopsis dassonvillei TaxID=2014 RepID=UPI00366B4824
MSTPPLDHYDRVYTAAAQMLWSQHGTYVWRGTSWPADRSAAWTALEEELTRAATRAVNTLEGFDPAHHLLSRRSPDGAPITLSRAAADWQQRMAQDEGVTVVPRESGDLGIASDGAVVLSPSWHSWLGLALWKEMDARLAPGRPALTVGSDAQALADVLHGLAAQLRSALTTAGAAPAWFEAQPASRSAPPLADTASPIDHERLCCLARAAVESLPDRARLKSDFTITTAAAEAATRLVSILDGGEVSAWQEPTPGADPARHLAREGAHTTTVVEEAEALRQVFDSEPAPRRVHDHEVLGDFEQPAEPTAQDRLVLMPAGIAQLTAEVLDEFAARVTPYQHSAPLLFDTYPLCVFLRRLDARLQAL